MQRLPTSDTMGRLQERLKASAVARRSSSSLVVSKRSMAPGMAENAFRTPTPL
jgi:hypothetical protein